MKAFVAVLIFLAAAAAHAQPFTDPEQAGQWFTYYYLKPEPERIPDALRTMSAAGLLKPDKGAAPVTGFLAGVLAARPQGARALAQRLSFLPEDEQSVLLLGLWYSGIPDANSILKEISAAMPGHEGRIRFLLATPAPRIVEMPPDQGAWVLDAWWGYFLATGDELPVRAVIAVLPWVEVRGDVGRLAIGGAARWSLASNAVQHDRVLEICKAQLSVQPPETARLLGEVVKAAEAERAKR
jgi:hypothetical protein